MIEQNMTGDHLHNMFLQMLPNKSLAKKWMVTCPLNAERLLTRLRTAGYKNSRQMLVQAAGAESNQLKPVHRTWEPTQPFSCRCITLRVRKKQVWDLILAKSTFHHRDELDVSVKTYVTSF